MILTWKKSCGAPLKKVYDAISIDQIAEHYCALIDAGYRAKIYCAGVCHPIRDSDAESGRLATTRNYSSNDPRTHRQNRSPTQSENAFDAQDGRTCAGASTTTSCAHQSESIEWLCFCIPKALGLVQHHELRQISLRKRTMSDDRLFEFMHQQYDSTWHAFLRICLWQDVVGVKLTGVRA